MIKRYLGVVCLVRLLTLLVIALLILNTNTSFAWQDGAVQQESATKELSDREKSDTTIHDQRTWCAVDSSSALPAAKLSSPFQTSAKPPSGPPPITPVLGPQRTLFILFNFLDNQITPITREDMYAAAFTYERGIANYYATTSYGKISVTGDVAGWFTIPYNENGSCDVGNWRNAANTAASAAGYNLTNYSHFVYIWPQNNPYTGVQSNGCGWSGYSNGANSYINAWVNSNGYFYGASAGNPMPDDLVWVISHEFGHGLGLTAHAAALRCDDGRKTIDSYSACEKLTTADYDDVMSYSKPTRELNAPHRDALGWFDPGQVQDVTSDGTYTISPLEYRDSNVKALRIRKPDTNEYYYLSYRRQAGPFDSFLFAKDGASVHIWDGYTASASRALYAQPWTAADYYSVKPSALIDGMRFEDGANGIQVSQVSHDGNRVTLSIRFGGMSCQNYNPLVRVFPASGSVVNANAGYYSQPYDLVVFNNNCVACSSSDFTLSSTAPFGWATMFSGSRHTVAPQSYVLLNDQIQPSANSALGDYSFIISATRVDAPAHTASASGTVRITTTDVTPPTAPANLTASANNTTISLSWAASDDNVGVTTYRILREDVSAGGSVFFNTPSTSYTDNGTNPDHLYRYSVDAGDAAGFRSQAAVVTISANAPIINIIAPAEGARVSGTVSVTVAATANRGVLKVELYVDNKLTATSTAAPFTTSWNTRKASSGRHGIQCKVYDTVGNSSVSGVVTVEK